MVIVHYIPSHGWCAEGCWPLWTDNYEDKHIVSLEMKPIRDMNNSQLNPELENKWGHFSFLIFILTSTSVTITLGSRGLEVSWRLWPALRLSFSRRTRPWVLLQSNSTWQIREMDTGRGLKENKWTENEMTVKIKGMFSVCSHVQ